jgi:hypothetical protein
MAEGHASSFTGGQGQGKRIIGEKDKENKRNRIIRGKDASWAM